MGLGATIKVRLDTAAVKRGLARIRAGFSRLGSTLRGIGGAMRKSLVPVVGILAGFGFAARKVANMGSELSDMSVQTGVAVEDLVKMQEALRLAGVPMRDTSRMLSMLASNIQEASEESNAARDAFHDLGIRMGDIRHLPLDEAFELILRRIRDGRGEIKFLERDMEQLFGARMGFGILRLANDLDNNMDRAAKSAAGFAKFMGENADDLDRTADALGRIGMLFNEVIGRILVRLPLRDIAKAIEGFDVSGIGAGLAKFLQDPGAAFGRVWEWLKNKFAELVKMLTDGISNVFDNVLNRLGKMLNDFAAKIPGSGILGGLDKLIMGIQPLEFRSKPEDIFKGAATEKGQRETLRVLERIERKGGAQFVG